MLRARHAKIRAKNIIVEYTLVITKVQVAKLWIPDFMLARIQVCNRTRSRFLRPESRGILAQKMVIIGLVHDERDLGGARRTLGFKGTHLNIGIVSQASGDHIRTRLWAPLQKSAIARGRTRLVKGGIAVHLSFTALHLFGVIHIHCIRETVMGFSERFVLIPTVRLKRGFSAAQWRLARAGFHMLGTEGFPWLGLSLTRCYALALMWAPRVFDFPGFPGFPAHELWRRIHPLL